MSTNTSPSSSAKNPNDASARGVYEPVITDEVGTYEGRPARIALYGTRYGAFEVQGRDGRWTVVHDVKWGGIRAIASLRENFDMRACADDVAAFAAFEAESSKALAAALADPTSPLVCAATAIAAALSGDEFVGPNDAETEAIAQAAVRAAEAAQDAEVADAIARETAFESAQDAEVGPKDVDARALATVEEVRAAYDAEATGACRPAVLRALRARAGELALGIVDAPKAERAVVARKPAREVVVDGSKAKREDVEALRAVLAVAAESATDGEPLVVPAAAFSAEAGFPTTAREKGNHWRYDRPGVKAAAALGLAVEWDGRKQTVTFVARAAS